MTQHQTIPATAADPSEEEKQRIQKKQGGHHMPPRPEDGPPLDDTDRNTDKIIKPSQQPSPGK